MTNQQKILKYLEKDAKLTPKNIADALSLPIHEVEKVIHDGEQDGTILGYSALVDWDKTGGETVSAVKMCIRDRGSYARQLCNRK